MFQEGNLCLYHIELRQVMTTPGVLSSEHWTKAIHLGEGPGKQLYREDLSQKSILASSILGIYETLQYTPDVQTDSFMGQSSN